MLLVFSDSFVMKNIITIIVPELARIMQNLIPYMKILETETAFWYSSKYLTLRRKPYQAPWQKLSPVMAMNE
jgi:hypothetical protein